MEERPIIKLTLTTSDWALELLGWAALLALWGLILTHYPNLPAIIPTHYNLAGVADDYGKKASLLLLPFVATVLFIGLTLLNRYPHQFNYLVPITPDNALSQYTAATRLLRYLKLILVVVFGLLAYQTIRQARGAATGLGVWFLPVMLALVLVPLLYFGGKSLLSTRS